MDRPNVGKPHRPKGVEETPELPNFERLFKNLYQRVYGWIRRHLGRRAAAAFVAILLVLYYAPGILPKIREYLEIAPGVSTASEWLHDVTNPLPKADPARFSIALVHLQNDTGHNLELSLARELKTFDRAVGVKFLQFDRQIDLRDQTDDSEKAGHEKARRYLKESGAQALIWGTIWTVGGQSAAQLFYTTLEESRNSEQAYQPPQDLKLQLPAVQRRDLIDVLGLVVATQGVRFWHQEGHFIADQLRPFIARVSRLRSESGGQDWAAETRARVDFILAYSLQIFGDQKGDDSSLGEAVALYNEALKEYTRKRVPLGWAMTQNSLGIALETLGEREWDTTHLEQAVTAYNEALKERTRERVPLAWAMTQNNLGNALEVLGTRKWDVSLLEQAVTALNEALKEYTRKRVPLAWAMTQNNLGIALEALGYTLEALGQRESGTTYLEQAVTTYNEALKEYTRERVPLAWAMTQNNLGTALEQFGERESGTTRLKQAVAAYNEALKERTRERVPLKWAATQDNLGSALETLGEREQAPELICEALGDHLGAWQVFSNRAPYYAAKSAVLAKNDVAVMQGQFERSIYRKCIEGYRPTLIRMGVVEP
jgi:tetratricopeptide (TPR) repeat protein